MSYVESVLDGSEKVKDGFPAIVYFILNTNIVSRYLLYLLIGGFIGAILDFSLRVGLDANPNNVSDTYAVFIWFISTLGAYGYPFFLERDVLKFRKKYGLSIYKGVRKEVSELREKLYKERHTIIIKDERSDVDKSENVIDKSDIGYWHGLLEKGAITQEEFEKKKAALL